MLRVCAIVLAAYNCGYPGLAAFRPAVFDLPLTSFHSEVNAAIRQAISGAEIAGDKLMVLASNGADRAKRELAGDFSTSQED
jgi:hypothetical protein